MPAPPRTAARRWPAALAALCLGALAACDAGPADRPPVPADGVRPPVEVTNPSTRGRLAPPALRVTLRVDPSDTGPQAERRSVELYVPAGAGPHPWVLYVHGGGYRRVFPSRGEPVARALQAAGYAVALAGYRLSSDDPDAGGVRHPEHARDLAAATRRVVDSAAAYRIDPERRAVVGHSSGAQLAGALLANPTFLAERGLRTADWDAGVLLDGVEYRLDDLIRREQQALPPSVEAVYGVTRTRTAPGPDARPVGYAAGPLYDVAVDPDADGSGPWLYPPLLSADGEPPRLAAPHALNATPYHNVVHGDPVPPLLMVFGETVDRERAALGMRDAARARGVAAEVYDARPLNHAQVVLLFEDAGPVATAYRQAVIGWLDAHVR